MKAVYDKAAFSFIYKMEVEKKMNRSRDKPGKLKAVIKNAFFVGKQTKVQPAPACKAADINPLERVRKYLYEIMIDADKGSFEKTKEELYLQIDEMLHAPILIWKNGVCYGSWGEYLENETNSYDSYSKGDTVVSLFLLEENDEL